MLNAISQVRHRGIMSRQPVSGDEQPRRNAHAEFCLRFAEPHSDGKYVSGPKFGEAYTIDVWGNLTAINSYQGKPYEGLNCGPANSNNQLNTCYGYDAAGNLMQNGSVLYTYDAERIDSLLRVALPILYDGDGKRVMKSSGTIYWRGIGDDALAESNLSGTISAEYAYLNGTRMVRMDRPGGAAHLYFHWVI